MADDNHHDDIWYRGKVSRRRLIGYGVSAGALGAVMSVPAPWQAAIGQAKPYKIGTLQPLVAHEVGDSIPGSFPML